MRVAVWAAGCVVALGLAAPGVAQTAYPIAGVNPDRRPEGAPTVKSVQHDAAWRARFYKGVAQPYPPGLGEADQGDWFTPFNRPGATPPYDLRGWHARMPREGAKPASKSRS